MQHLACKLPATSFWNKLRKATGESVATIYRNKEQVFYRLAVKVTEEVTEQLVTGKSDKLQPIATSYSNLHGASNVIKKWRPHQQVFLNIQNVSNA